MEPADSESSGTGGGLRYFAEAPDPGMVNQEHSHSCQAACARQILKDGAVDISEQELLAKIGYIEGYGTTSANTATVLDELHPAFGYAGGSVAPEAVTILFRRAPWIACLKTDHGTVHAVIVDKLEGDVVHVRDPWGLTGPGSALGTRATIKLSDFMEHWHWALNNVVIPNRRK